MRFIDKLMELYREYYGEPEAQFADLVGLERIAWTKITWKWVQDNGFIVT